MHMRMAHRIPQAQRAVRRARVRGQPGFTAREALDSHLAALQAVHWVSEWVSE